MGLIAGEQMGQSVLGQVPDRLLQTEGGMGVHGGSGKLLLIALRRRDPVPLAEQIAARVREMVQSGALTPGDRLPSSRGLAKDLRVARNTVTAAFQTLLAEGFVETRRGGSVRVAASLHGVARGPVGAPVAAVLPSPLRAGRHLTTLEALVRNAPPLTSAGKVPRAFRPSVPAMDLFPVELWGRLLSRSWRRASLQTLGYGEPLGHRPLRESVAQYLRVSRGVVCTADQVVITLGSQQGLDLACRILVAPGDTAWVEDPGYVWGRGALVAAGARVQPVPVDAEGMTVPALAAGQPVPRLALVTPTRQLPLGIQMSLARRRQLLAAAAASGMAILEDDYDAAFSFSEQPLPALCSLDRHGLVLHAGTFSKTLYPALRLGYLIVPMELTASFEALRRVSDFQAPILEQATLDLFIREGHLDRHVRRMRTVYLARHRLLASLLRRHAAGLLEVQEAAGGMNLVAWLPPGTDDVECAHRAAQAGVDLMPLSAFTVQRRLRPGLLLGFSGLREDEIEVGVRTLVQALAERPLPRSVAAS